MNHRHIKQEDKIMHGLMMDVPLTITSVMQFAEKHHSNTEIVSVTADNPRHRYTYKNAFIRTRKLANAITKFGIGQGDRVGTLAWNDYRHFELYYAVAGVGAIIHTINPRLFSEQIRFIINHAGDRIIFVDPLVLPLLEKLQHDLPALEAVIVLSDMKHMPETTLTDVHCYETFIENESEQFDWPELDENTACGLCYSSGTTGDPKGVMYSHRSNVLHSYASIQPNVFGLSLREVIMPIVPMFHVNAWGTPYAATMAGTKVVFPGPKMGDGATLQSLIVEENVTLSAGVPTVWLALLDYLEQTNQSIPSLKRIIVGGAACPLSIIKTFSEKHGVTVHHAWGMTETSPLGCFNVLKPGMESLPETNLDTIHIKQGKAIYGVEIKIVDDTGKELPWDGESAGLLKIRGPWICSDYYRQEGDSDSHQDGWFNTGDVATIDSDGYVQLTDRAKDMVKSGGEWISSIHLENIAVDHPRIAEAAVIAVPHPKWGERPLLIIVKKDDEKLAEEEILDWLKDKVASWWLPDAVEFVDEIPHTATGKIQKMKLREQFRGYQLSDK